MTEITIIKDLHALRPASSGSYRVFVCTEHGEVYNDTGSGWVEIANQTHVHLNDHAAIHTHYSATTLFVAATNASQDMKDIADYTCDGVADEVQINAAIAALPLNGGIVELSYGTFTIADPIAWTKADVIIKGHGKDATVINVASGENCNAVAMGDGVTQVVYPTIHDLKLTTHSANTSGSGVVAEYAYGLLIYNTAIVGFPEYGIYGGADADASNYAMIFNNFISSNDLHGIWLRGFMPASQIVGNFIHSNGTAATDSAGLRLTASQCAVVGNRFANNIGHGIHNSGDDNIISNNHIIGHQRHGILTDTAGIDATIIIGNLISSFSEETDNTYSGIKLTAVTYNSIMGNTIKGSSIGKYCIEETGASDNNVISGNTCQDFVTGAIIKVGAATRVSNNPGHVTENTVLSGTFTIDSTGVKTVTIAHGLAVTPALKDCTVTVTEDTDVDDWAFSLLKVESVGATNVVAKINVSTASATGGATAKLGLMVVVI